VKRPYETCVVFDGTLSDDVIAKEQQQVEKLLNQSAEIEQVRSWGRRRLAYAIKRKRSGVYCLFLYQGEGDVPVKLERMFKLNQNVLRYLTVCRDPDAQLAEQLPQVHEAPQVQETEHNADFEDNVDEEEN